MQRNFTKGTLVTHLIIQSARMMVQWCVLTDDDCTNSKEDTSSLAEHIKEYLRHRLRHRTLEDLGWFTHNKAEDDVEQEPTNICEGHGKAYCPWRLQFWFSHLFCDVCCSV